jgi:prophage endopeptidase
MGMFAFLMRPVVLVLIALAVGLGCGWWVNGWRWEAKYNTLQANYATQLKGVSDAAAADYAQKLADLQGKNLINAQLAQDTQTKLQAVQDENKTLSAAVASGDKRVRLQASTIAALRGQLSTTPSSASGPDGAGIELTAAAGQTVLDLRSAIQSDAIKIKGLQDYITTVCLKPSS